MILMLTFALARGTFGNELLMRAQSAHATLLSRSTELNRPLDERTRAQLRIGQFDPNSADAAAFRIESPDAARWIELQYTLDHYRFSEIPQLPVLRLRVSDTPYSLALRYRWMFIQEDLATVDRGTLDITAKSDPVRIAARAELKLRTLEYDSALTYATWALRAARHAPERATAQVIGARVLYKLNRYAECRDSLTTLFDAEHLDAEVMFQTALVLIQLGQTSDAIDLLAEAIRWNPWHEGAQYFLGNGYSRLNYSQIADSAGSMLPEAAELVRAGSAAWTTRDYDDAEAKFREALRLVPAYGRARNGLAKALEGRRMLVNVHRAEDERVFEAKATTRVPRIDEYVLNWSRLSERHRKQVALAVEPWKLYIPLLVECGEHHYIKPLHEKLSECPNMETMKDQRVGYDTRLWDDVRGCGGFTTVTGIEDVERSIFSNYNTVLHELTHQVHGTFPSADLKRLDDLWQATRKRDDAGVRTFLSRYQASSVWEYFAEGANAYHSPRRDNYDTREIVRERLLTMDTALVRLVEDYLTAPNLDACWPVGLINACDDAIERAELERAANFAGLAQKRDPHAEVVLAALSHLNSLRDEDDLAVAFADTLARRFPGKARSYAQLESALYMSKANSEPECVELLARGLTLVDTTERKDLMQTLGGTLVMAGRHAEARNAYQYVLDRQPTDYSALWGMASALRNDPRADSLFRAALAERTGITALRCDYAEYLIATNRVEEAREQVAEAELIKPEDATVMMARGLLAKEDGKLTTALESFERALLKPESPRLAAVRKAWVLRQLGRDAEANELATRLRKEAATDVPTWIYDTENSTYVIARAWDAKARDLLAEYFAKP